MHSEISAVTMCVLEYKYDTSENDYTARRVEVAASASSVRVTTSSTHQAGRFETQAANLPVWGELALIFPYQMGLRF